MTRAGRVFSSLRVTYFHQAVTTLVGLWLTPFLLARIGAEGVGLWLLATQITGYLLLLDLGVIAILPREVARVQGARIPETGDRDLRTLLHANARAVLVQWPVVALIAALIVLFLPDSWAALRGPLALALGVFTLLFPARILQAALVGLQDLTYVARTQFLAWAVLTIMSIGGVLAGFGLWSLAAGWATGQLVTAIGCGWRLSRRHGLGAQRWLRPDARREDAAPAAPVRATLRGGMWASLSQVSTVLLSGTDLLVIGHVLSPTLAVVYSVTGKLVTVFANQPYAIGHAAMPALAELRARGDVPRLTAVTGALALAILLISGGIATVVIACNAAFVDWWVGADQWGGAALSLAFVALMLLRHLTSTYSYALFALADERTVAIVGVAEGLTAVALMLALIPRVGLIGAPLGALAAATLISLPQSARRVAAILRVNAGAVLRPLLPWLLRFVVVAALAYAISRMYQPVSLVGIALLAAAMGGIYLVLMLPIAFRSTLGPYLRAHLPSRLVARLELGQSH